MRYRTLPRSNTDIAEICFGSMRFIPPDSPSEARGEGARALDAAIDGGVNVIHSSHEYPTFDATGELLSRHPKRGELHHIVKVESPDYDDPDFDAASFREQVERSLRTLHTERLTVVQHLQRGPRVPKPIAYSAEGDDIRVPAFESIKDPLFEVAQELKDEGKIGELASFPHTMGYARRAVQEDRFDGMVHFFNLLETEMLELFPTMQRKDMSFIAIRPVLQGMLTDKRVDRSQLAAADPRREDRWDPWYELLAQIREVLPEQPDSWTDFALQFSLAHPAVTTLVIGMNTVEQVESALAAVESGYPSADVVEQVDAVSRAFGRIPKETLFG